MCAGEWNAVEELLHAPLPSLRSGMLSPKPGAPQTGDAQSAPAALCRPTQLGLGPAGAASAGGAACIGAMSAVGSATSGYAAGHASGAAALTERAAGVRATGEAGAGRGGAGALGEHLERLLLEAVASGCASRAQDIMALLSCTLAWLQVRACHPPAC